MYEKYAHLRDEQGLTDYAVAKATGIGRSSFNDWKTGRSKLKADKIQKLADFFHVPVTYFYGEQLQPVRQGVRIPVFGYIRAGIPLEAIQEIIDYEEISPELASRGRYFALQVKGDSMMPDLREGDTVIVKEQATAENGDTAIVLVNGDEATVKRVLFTDKGLTLLPTNTAYAPMVYTRQQVQELPVQIIGKVVELRRKL